MKTDNEFKVIVDTLDEEEAEVLLAYLTSKFHYTGILWKKSDAEAYLNRALTPLEWNNINTSDDWDTLSEIGDADNHFFQNIIDNVIDDDDDTEPNERVTTLWESKW